MKALKSLGSGGVGTRRIPAGPGLTGRPEGELVYWSSSKLDWLEGRGERVCLIELIHTASHRLFVQFVRHNSSVENLAVLRTYIERYGCPLQVWTNQSSHFVTVQQKNHPVREAPLPLTRIGYVLKELGIAWTSEGPAQARRRIPRVLRRAHRQIIQGLRLAGAKTLDDANAFLESEFLAKPGGESVARDSTRIYPVVPISPSRAEPRLLGKDATFRFKRTFYRVVNPPSRSGKAHVEVRQLSSGQVVAEMDGKRLTLVTSHPAQKPESVRSRRPGSSSKKRARPKTRWMDGFYLKRGPTVEQAIAVSNTSY